MSSTYSKNLVSQRFDISQYTKKSRSLAILAMESFNYFGAISKPYPFQIGYFNNQIRSLKRLEIEISQRIGDENIFIWGWRIFWISKLLHPFTEMATNRYIVRLKNQSGITIQKILIYVTRD